MFGTDTAEGLPKLQKINLTENLLLIIHECRFAREHKELQEFVRSRLEDEAFRNPVYAAWARTLRISESTLRRRFRHETGEAIHAYVQRLRLAKARQLLRSSEMPLREVAEACGYTDEFYFNRHFHKKTGITPSRFRRSSILSHSASKE